ncbi:MAG: TetR/AcrR family transcriptional regulator [Desulfobacterales bacterium]|nr:TetR/AcrR family transcriptional regulator [Desulfobacterales bacterium]
MASPSVPRQPAATHRENQKAQTRALILETARNLFEEAGFEKATMRAIAARAQMGYGTIFKHFTNKRDLLAACLHDAIDATLADAFESLPAEAGLRQQFIHLARALIHHYGRRPQLSRTLIEGMIHVDGTWKTALDGQVNRFLVTLEDLVQTAKNRGEIRDDVESALLALSLFSTYLIILAMSLRAARFDPEQTIHTLDQLVDLHLTGATTH